ncbi:MAG: DUF5723 family protein [Cryomorphaceae bacterium]
MKRFWLAALCLASASLGAQDLLYAQRGNPAALMLNPAADVDARVWLAIPALNATVQTSFAAGDVLGGDLGTLWRKFPSEAAGALTYNDIQLFSLGFKSKTSIYWLGSSLNVDASGFVDRDLIGFALWGMKDANGIIDLNYDGNFNQTSAVASARSNVHLGWQREFGQKLRLGATFNLTQVLAHAELYFDSLGLRSTDVGNGFNELMLVSQGSVAAFSGAGIDFLNGTFNFDADKLFATSFATLDLGATYDLGKRWRLAGSIQGLGGATSLASDTAVSFNGRIPFEGFSYSSSVDTSLDAMAYFDTLLVQIQDFAKNSSGGMASFSPLRRVDLAAYWRSPNKTHQLGLHYLARSRPALSFQALAAEYHGFYGRRLQLSASYTQPLTGSVAMRPSVSVQTTLRLAAGLALNLGTSTANMLPQLTTTNSGALTVGLPANLDRLNVNVGLHWMLYEKSYRKAVKERGAAKKVKRAAQEANRAATTN